MFKEEIKLELNRLWLDEKEQEFPWHGASRKGDSSNTYSVPSLYQRVCYTVVFISVLLHISLWR